MKKSIKRKKIRVGGPFEVRRGADCRLREGGRKKRSARLGKKGGQGGGDIDWRAVAAAEKREPRARRIDEKSRLALQKEGETPLSEPSSARIFFEGMASASCLFIYSSLAHLQWNPFGCSDKSDCRSKQWNEGGKGNARSCRGVVLPCISDPGTGGGKKKK